MDSFKDISDADFIKLIKKFGADDAINIINLMRLTNKPLDDAGGSSRSAFTTDVRKIISDLPNMHEGLGLTRSEYEVLKFWASQLGAGKLEFLTTHVHTIIDARVDSCTKHDLRFIGDTVSCIKSCVARGDKKLSDWASEGYARIPAVDHWMLMVEADMRMGLLCEKYRNHVSFDRLWTPNAQIRIIEIEEDKHYLNQLIRGCDGSIQLGSQRQAATSTPQFLVECIKRYDEQIQLLKEQ